MLKTMLWTGLAACFLTLPAVNAGTDMGCLPPVKDYLKKTVRVEIKGQLLHVTKNDGSDPRYARLDIAIMDSWQIRVDGKTYILDLGPRLEYAKGDVRPMIALPPWNDLYGQADQLVNKTVIVTGTLDDYLVRVATLKRDESVKETTEVEARGQLRMQVIFPPIPEDPGIQVCPEPEWVLEVNGKTYTLTGVFASPELEKLAGKLEGKAVILTGELKGDAITVKTLKAAE